MRDMEEKSLRVYSDKKFFTKLTNTITKLLIPTKIGINGMLISIKRNNVLKAYENYTNSENVEADKQKNKNKKLHTIVQLIRGLLECQHPNKVVNWDTERKKKKNSCYIFNLKNRKVSCVNITDVIDKVSCGWGEY